MSEARKTIRKARLKEGSLLGTNGKAKVIPLLGDVSRGNAKNRLRLSAIPKAVPKRMIYAYAASLAGIATLLGVALLVRTGATHPWWAVAALAGVAALCERGRVKLSNTTESSIALLPVIFAAVVLGPLAALLVGAASLLGDFRPPYLKLVVYTSSRAITGAVAGFAAWFVAWLITDTFAAIAVGTLAAAIVAETADTSFAALTHKLRGNWTFANAVRLVAPLLVAAVPMYVPVVAILAAAYTEVSAWTLPLFFVPALAAQRLFALYREQRELAEELLSANSCLERAGLSFASALVATLDARDRYTAGHSAAVAVYARDIAARLGLPADQQQLAHLCGLVHDIGKVGLPPGLLEKAGPLTLEERRQMEEHPAIGERILANVENYAEIASIVRHHHERVDGNGYPDGLRGNDIPIVSRILAVADAYDAMTSDRPYREAMPTAVARMRLAQAVETQFDTTIVAAFEAILAGAPDSYRRATVEPARSDASPQRLSAPSVAAL